ncbi:uncharacterized protein L201_001000 [Kwoniella dendrophila CBS 6074]|uniref:Uncharacterized protein n=1 Tax=Kwoniella dendrophila CBS 6074 TaxID=1295534 RepID=A0AAX4JL66_9TREE
MPRSPSPPPRGGYRYPYRDESPPWSSRDRERDDYRYRGESSRYREYDSRRDWRDDRASGGPSGYRSGNTYYGGGGSGGRYRDERYRDRDDYRYRDEDRRRGGSPLRRSFSVSSKDYDYDPSPSRPKPTANTKPAVPIARSRSKSRSSRSRSRSKSKSRSSSKEREKERERTGTPEEGQITSPSQPSSVSDNKVGSSGVPGKPTTNPAGLPPRPKATLPPPLPPLSSRRRSRSPPPYRSYARDRSRSRERERERDWRDRDRDRGEYYNDSRRSRSPYSPGPLPLPPLPPLSRRRGRSPSIVSTISTRSPVSRHSPIKRYRTRSPSRSRSISRSSSRSRSRTRSRSPRPSIHKARPKYPSPTPPPPRAATNRPIPIATPINGMLQTQPKVSLGGKIPPSAPRSERLPIGVPPTGPRALAHLSTPIITRPLGGPGAGLNRSTPYTTASNSNTATHVVKEAVKSSPLTTTSGLPDQSATSAGTPRLSWSERKNLISPSTSTIANTPEHKPSPTPTPTSNVPLASTSSTSSIDTSAGIVINPYTGKPFGQARAAATAATASGSAQNQLQGSLSPAKPATHKEDIKPQIEGLKSRPQTPPVISSNSQSQDIKPFSETQRPPTAPSHRTVSSTAPTPTPASVPSLTEAEIAERKAKLEEERILAELPSLKIPFGGLPWEIELSNHHHHMLTLSNNTLRLQSAARYATMVLNDAEAERIAASERRRICESQLLSFSMGVGIIPGV